MNNPEPDLPGLLKPKSIPLPSLEEKFTRLLGGPPETANMKSGCVVLLPGESVGMHSTGEREEIIIPLAGTGELIIPGEATFKVMVGHILYNPPNTPHDVINTGNQALQYVYIVANV